MSGDRAGLAAPLPDDRSEISTSLMAPRQREAPRIAGLYRAPNTLRKPTDAEKAITFSARPGIPVGPPPTLRGFSISRLPGGMAPRKSTIAARPRPRYGQLGSPLYGRSLPLTVSASGSALWYPAALGGSDSNGAPRAQL